ncbi:MAG: hypothetical protein EOP06_24345 [Proteobacteria bacterium]|nr:MAG: hypothetical protein EOP06_24345 [Pseudomonadota bacterium]
MEILKILSFIKKIKLKEDRTLLYAFVALGIFALMIQLLGGPAKEAGPASNADLAFDVDTMIPAGFILIPIELSNAESLSSLTGQFAVVDLYAASANGKKGFKIASSVKLLRAPLNPQQYAVLMREEESAKLVTMTGPFFAALKNRKDKSRSGLERSTKNNLIISYGG